MSKEQQITVSIKPVWYIYLNEDNTEGRGLCYPTYPCKSRTTCKRFAEGRGVQGSNAPLHKGLGIQYKNQWYYTVPIQEPTEQDTKEDAIREARADRTEILKEALCRPLSPDEVRSLQLSGSVATYD